MSEIAVLEPFARSRDVQQVRPNQDVDQVVMNEGVPTLRSVGLGGQFVRFIQGVPLRQLMDAYSEAYAELEWEYRFTTASPQRTALQRLLEDGREQYEAGETEEIDGDTFA
jgi:hypothetical protein